MKAILFIFLIFLNADLISQNLKIDTAFLPRPKIFEYAFSIDSTLEDATSGIRFYHQDFGDIQVKSGKIVLSSVEGLGETDAFIRHFPTGSFPVQLAIAINDTDSHLAFCRILFSREEVVKWEYAYRPHDEKRDLKHRIFDNNCFVGESQYPIYLLGDSITMRYYQSKPGSLSTDELARFTYDFSYKAQVLKLGKEKIISLNGEFNRCYSAYLGYDKDGKICRLLIDTGNLALNPILF